MNKQNGELDAALQNFLGLASMDTQATRERGFDFSKDYRLLNEIVWHYGLGKYSPGIATERAYYISLNGMLVAFRGKDGPRVATAAAGAATATKPRSRRR